MAEFDNYPRYQLEKYGNEIKLILKNAAEFYGMQVSDEKDDIYRGVEYATHPSMKNTVGGAEHLRKGTAENGAKVIFDDQFITESDANSNTVVYYEHTSSIDDTTTTRTPLAIGDFTTIKQIKQMFEDVSGQTTSLPQLKTPITLFANDGIYSYSDDRTETTQITTYNNISKLTDGIKFNLQTNSYKTSDIDITCESVDLYTNSIPLSLLRNQMPTTVAGTQAITTQQLGDDFAFTDSTISNKVYRITLGLPVVKLTDSQFSTVTKLATISLPEAENDAEFGLYPAAAKIVSFDSDESIAKDYRTIKYDHYHYNYSTGDLFKLTVKNDASSSDFNLLLKKGDFIKARIDFDYDAWKADLQADHEASEFNQLNVDDLIMLDYSPANEAIATNFKQYPKPAAVIYNPENSLVYCFHATSTTGNTALPKSLSFVYKIERPDVNELGKTTWVTVLQGVTADNIVYSDNTVPVLPAAFFLRKGDRLTIKSRALYYEDSEEYVFELTDEILNTPAPSGIFYTWNLYGPLTDGTYGFYTEDAVKSNLIPPEVLKNPLMPSIILADDSSAPDFSFFDSINNLLESEKYTEEQIWGILFKPPVINSVAQIDDSTKFLFTPGFEAVKDDQLETIWSSENILEISGESVSFINPNDDSLYEKDDTKAYEVVDENNVIISDLVTKLKTYNLGLVNNRTESRAAYLQFVADTFEENICLDNGISYIYKQKQVEDLYEHTYKHISDDQVKAMIRKYALIKSDEKDIQTGIYYSVLEKMIKEYDTRKLLLKVFPMDETVEGNNMDKHIATLISEILSEKANKVELYDFVPVADNKYDGQVTVNVKNNKLATLTYNGATYNLTKEETGLVGTYTATHIEDKSKTFSLEAKPIGINETESTGTITFVIPELASPIIEWFYVHKHDATNVNLFIFKNITDKNNAYIELNDNQTLFTKLVYNNINYDLTKATDGLLGTYSATASDASQGFDVTITDTSISFLAGSTLVGWDYEIKNAIYEEPNIDTTTKDDITWLVTKYSTIYYFNPKDESELLGTNNKKLTIVDKMLEDEKVCAFIEKVFTRGTQFKPLNPDAKAIVADILSQNNNSNKLN